MGYYKDIDLAAMEANLPRPSELPKTKKRERMATIRPLPVNHPRPTVTKTCRMCKCSETANALAYTQWDREHAGHGINVFINS